MIKFSQSYASDPNGFFSIFYCGGFILELVP